MAKVLKDQGQETGMVMVNDLNNHAFVVTAPSQTEFKVCLDNILRHMMRFLGCPVQGQELDFNDSCESFSASGIL